MQTSRRVCQLKKYLAIYGKPRYLGFIEHEENIDKGVTIIAESYRGEEIAVIVGMITNQQETAYRQLRNASEYGDSSNKATEPVVTDLKFLRIASTEEMEISSAFREEEKDVLKQARNISIPHNLDMKLIDVEFLMNKRKLFFYFSSEQRVDFRAYVRDLAKEFKTRIELRQIGVRDEAKVIGGIGPCGQSCCCSYWLNQFAPICIKMVKEQNLALNPAKISGICGRLMCCMGFEHEVYKELWSNLPNPGTKIKSLNGNIILTGVELHKNNVRCFVPGKGEIKIPINRFEEFKAKVTTQAEWDVLEFQDQTLDETDVPTDNFTSFIDNNSNTVTKKDASNVRPRLNKRRKMKNKAVLSNERVENKKKSDVDFEKAGEAKKPVRQARNKKFRKKKGYKQNKKNSIKESVK